ncbi:MAG: secY/secA suppressor protein, partial [Enterobacterales bacterium]|nr:secY/secA suppressor protein [Enterobacterales bacterium]
EGGDGVPLFSGEAAQAIFDNDYDEVEIREEWITENTLYEWDEDDFQYEPPLDTEEGEAASDEWEEQN